MKISEQVLLEVSQFKKDVNIVKKHIPKTAAIGTGVGVGGGAAVAATSSALQSRRNEMHNVLGEKHKKLTDLKYGKTRDESEITAAGKDVSDYQEKVRRAVADADVVPWAAGAAGALAGGYAAKKLYDRYKGKKNEKN